VENNEDKIVNKAEDRAMEEPVDDKPQSAGESSARDTDTGAVKKARPERNRKSGKRIALIVAACAVGLCVLLVGGFGIWWAVTAPKGAVNLTQPTQKDIKDLYREKSARTDRTPHRLDILLGPVEDSRLAANGSGFAKVASDGSPQFQDREWLLTDLETYERMRQDTDIQREMQVRALIKLALTENCERVSYCVEYVELPQDGEITTIAQYVAANGGQGGQGGYTFVFSASWASLAIGRDIKAVAANRESFTAFMEELESYEAVDSLIVPGVGTR